MGPTSARPVGNQGPLPPSSPRPNGARPTSELLGSAGMFQTPEGESHYSRPSSRALTFSSLAEAIDQWFETFQNYEVTLVSVVLLISRSIPNTRTGRNGCCLS